HAVIAEHHLEARQCRLPVMDQLPVPRLLAYGQKTAAPCRPASCSLRSTPPASTCSTPPYLLPAALGRIVSKGSYTIQITDSPARRPALDFLFPAASDGRTSARGSQGQRNILR